MTSLVVVSAGLSNPSSTRLLADRLAAATAEALGDVEVTHVELRDLAHQLTDQLLTGFPGPKLAARSRRSPRRRHHRRSPRSSPRPTPVCSRPSSTSWRPARWTASPC